MSLTGYRLTDANLWTGVHRRGIPTVILTLRPCEWGLPFALHVGGHLLSKPGLTFVVGPLHISWSRL